MAVLGAHRLDQARGGRRIEPEQPVGGDVVAVVEHQQVEGGAVEGRLSQPRLDLGSVAGAQVVGALRRVVAPAGSVALVERADGRASVGVQPRDDDLELLGVFGLEAALQQGRAHRVVVAVDHHVDGVEAERARVGEPSFDHPVDAVGRGARHQDRVEREPVAPVGGDDGGLGTTRAIEPEELRHRIGGPRRAPPPVEVGGLQRPRGGVRAPRAAQERRRRLEVVHPGQHPLDHRPHSRPRARSPSVHPGFIPGPARAARRSAPSPRSRCRPSSVRRPPPRPPGSTPHRARPGHGTLARSRPAR